MKTKIRKQVRGFDIAEFLAFGTFPNIKNISIENNYAGTVHLQDTRTGEVVHDVPMNMEDCRKLAKAANKMIRDNNKFFKEEK